MEDKFVKFNESADWSNYTIIFPCVSVGNIGQLAVDLLISSLPNTQKCGYLISSLVQPIVGYDAYLQNSTELSLSCDCWFNFFLFDYGLYYLILSVLLKYMRTKHIN